MIRPIWIQMGATGVFLIFIGHLPSVYAMTALGGFLVGISVGLWK